MPKFCLILLFAAAPAEARVIRLVIEHREPAGFASPIPYEQLTGHFDGALDPKNACGFSGGLIPFARNREQRLASGDPRPSLEERYGTHERYVEKVREAAKRLAEQRFLLPDDAERLIREAESSEVLR